MNKTFKQKVQAQLRKHKLSAKVQKAVWKELNQDHILPQLRTTCKVSSEIVKGSQEVEDDFDSFNLYIGPRDWQWDSKTGEFIGAGCEL